MAMELGIDKKQIEAMKDTYRRWTSDPIQLRFLICVVFGLIAVLGIERPLIQRLTKARSEFAKAQEQAGMAEAVEFYRLQIDRYEARAAVPVDVVDWQNYVLGKLRETTTATLISFEPKKTESKGPFKIMNMEIVAMGDSYEEFTNFVHAIERGERLIRVSRCRVERQRTNLFLTCGISGLVKPGVKVTDADAADAGEADEVDAADTAGDVGEGPEGDLGLEPGEAPGGVDPGLVEASPAGDEDDKVALAKEREPDAGPPVTGADADQDTTEPEDIDQDVDEDGGSS